MDSEMDLPSKGPRILDILIHTVSRKVFLFLPVEDSARAAGVCKLVYGNAQIWKSMVSRRKSLLNNSVPGELSAKVYREAFYRLNWEFSSLPRFTDCPKDSKVCYPAFRHKTLRQKFFPILVNWLVELHFELFGVNERRRQCKSPLKVIHLATRYLYQFLAVTKEEVESTMLQLVGVVCYRLAIEGTVSQPDLRRRGLTADRYAYYTDGAYTAKMVNSMTNRLRAALSKRQRSPRAATARAALEELIRRLRLDTLTEMHARYIVDLTLHSAGFGVIRPSRVAAAAILVACETMDDELDKAVVQRFTFESTYDLSELVFALRQVSLEARRQETGREREGLEDRNFLPSESMVIKHYRMKFVDLLHGHLEPKAKVALFLTDEE